MIKNFFSKLFSSKSTSRRTLDPTQNALIIPRAQHNVSRKNISHNAIRILHKLNDAGFTAYLVGGSVRDLLLDIRPKDFDIATNATPEEVRRLFRNSRLIGRRFVIVHIHFGDQIIEVSTFRGPAPKAKRNHHKVAATGMILSDNVYGTLQEDAWRRDFTVNALYYDVKTFSIIDFTGGVNDLKNKTLRMIGTPAERYREDPVRMLRAIRFAAKLSFTLHVDTQEPIQAMAARLQDVPGSRLFEEFLKLFFTGNAVATYQLLKEYDILPYLFPEAAQVNAKTDCEFIHQGLRSTDQRIAEHKPVSPAFLCAVLLWPTYHNMIQSGLAQGLPLFTISQSAMQILFSQKDKVMALPRRVTEMVGDIFELQWHFEKRRKHQILSIFSNHLFRAAYDFLLLRAKFTPALNATLHWWTDFQESSPERQHQLIDALVATPRKKRRKRRKSSKKPVSVNPS